MNAYLDTSALLRACRLNLAPQGVTRTHSLFEFYCVLTGPGIVTMIDGRQVKQTTPPKEAARAARETFARVRFFDLEFPQALDELERAAKKNVHGKNIHDWMHCAAAARAKCESIVTLNFSDFSRMTDLPLVNPSKQFSGESAA